MISLLCSLIIGFYPKVNSEKNVSGCYSVTIVYNKKKHFFGESLLYKVFPNLGNCVSAICHKRTWVNDNAVAICIFKTKGSWFMISWYGFMIWLFSCDVSNDMNEQKVKGTCKIIWNVCWDIEELEFYQGKLRLANLIKSDWKYASSRISWTRGSKNCILRKVMPLIFWYFLRVPPLQFFQEFCGRVQRIFFTEFFGVDWKRTFHTPCKIYEV